MNRILSAATRQLLVGTGGLAIALVAQPAIAQTASTDQVAAAQASAPQPVTDASEDGTIVVTGSRIQKDGYRQPTPVTVATTEALLSAAPSSIADGLNQLPQFAGSRTRTFCCEVGSVGNYLNLRGLGSARTLVLLDSQRIVASREAGDVDVNLLPELLIQRVDVVTGGASAAYGSDAVSGVVNYVIDNKLVGVKGLAQYGVSQYGDDQSVKFEVAGGASFAEGRGHFVVSLEHYKTDGIPSLLDRSTSALSGFLGGNGTAAAPYTTIAGVRQNTATYGGVIVNAAGLPIAGPGAALAGMKFAPDGSTSPFVFGTPIAGSPAFSVGGDGISNNLADPAQSLRTDRGYARFSYELTDSITAHVRLNVAESRTRGDVLADNRQATVAFTLFRDNAYLPAAVGTALDAAGQTSFRLGRFNRDFGPIALDYRNSTYDVNVGLDGKIGSGWTWNVDYSRGATRLEGNVNNVSILGNLYAAADAVRDSSGNIVCRVTITNPGVFPGCVPINLFGEGKPSQSAKDYVLDSSRQVVRNTQEVFSAGAQGDLFSLPAGTVSVAFGGEYRKRTLLETANAVALSQIQATGVRGFPTALCPTVATCRFGGFNQGNFGEANASDDVKEGFIETVVPVLKDSALGRALDLNAAYRYTDYKNSGGVSTYKLGLSYEPVDGLRFRATRSRDIRAPNLFELFAGPVNAFQPGLTDPFTGVSNIIGITRTQGNPNLSPEKAKTTTLGVVYSPGWLPGFTGSVDYYDIDIKGALSATTSQGTLDACFRGDTGACSRISRDAAGTIQQIALVQVNLNSRKTRGIDIDLSYSHPVAGGKLGLRTVVNHAIDFTDTIGGVKTQQVGFYNTANQLTIPKWRGNVDVTYDIGGFGAFIQERYIGGYDQLPPLPGQLFATPHIGAVYYTDITLKYKLEALGNGTFEVFGSVNNLFGRKPPFVANRFAAGLGFPTPPGLYDLDNRYFTVGLRGAF